MNIHIKPITSNPFVDFPHFKKIWPEVSSKVAQEYTAEAFERGDSGIYIIYANEEPVGMTGFFSLENEYFWGLRWHGILPEFRGQGISDVAIALTAQALKEAQPESVYLVEYIPHTSYSGYLFKYFSKLGFEPYAEPETVDWAPHKIQAHSAELSSLIAILDKYKKSSPKIK